MMGRTKATKAGDSDVSKKNSDTANTLNKEPITNEHILAEIKIGRQVACASFPLGSSILK